MNDSQILETVKLETMFDDDAMVSCTPCWNHAIVLPTEVVPYAEHMVWVWEIGHPCRVNMALVIAKVPHRFKLGSHRRLRSGDTLAFDLFAEELDHGH